jgi:hypothetical protein
MPVLRIKDSATQAVGYDRPAYRRQPSNVVIFMFMAVELFFIIHP